MENRELRPAKSLLWIRLIGAFFGSFFLGGVLAALIGASGVSAGMAFIIGFILVAVPSFVYTILFFNTIRYTVSQDYVIVAYGILWKVKRSVPLDKITNIDVRQGPLERILGFGQVWIFTPSTGSQVPEEKLLGVQDPHEVKQFIIDTSKQDKDVRHSAVTSAKSSASSDEQTVLLREILSTLKGIKESLDKK